MKGVAKEERKMGMRIRCNLWRLISDAEGDR